MGVREEGCGKSKEPGSTRGTRGSHGEPQMGHKGATETHAESRRATEGGHRVTETHGEARRATEKHGEPHRATEGQREPHRDMENDGESKRDTERSHSHGEARDGH